MTKQTQNIVVIGGGTGSFTLLQELKKLTPNITAIVNMSDDGGSTGKLRDEYGVLPPGDIRQCLVALSNLPDVRELFNYRFGEGMLKGHSLGNVIISGLELQYNRDFEKAIQVASRLLNITGNVVPVTLHNHQLVLHDGRRVIKGQYEIERSTITSKSARIDHEPKVAINAQARRAILEADAVVIAPGNLYCSLLPALAVEGIAPAFAASKAQKIMVANLVNKPHQTAGWHVVDYLQAIERYIGAHQINTVLYNSRKPSDQLMAKYNEAGEHLIESDPERFNEVSAQLIGAPLVSGEVYDQAQNDTLMKRSFIRHDAKRVRAELEKLLDRN